MKAIIATTPIKNRNTKTVVKSNISIESPPLFDSTPRQPIMSRGVYMKRKIIALLLCFVCVSSLCFPVAADDDGYSAIISDIDKTCPTCGSALHAFWWSTSGAEVEVEISDTG